MKDIVKETMKKLNITGVDGSDGTMQDMELVHYHDEYNGESLGLLVIMDDANPNEVFHMVSCDIFEFTGDFGEWGVDLEGAIYAARDEDFFEIGESDAVEENSFVSERNRLFKKLPENVRVVVKDRLGDVTDDTMGMAAEAFDDEAAVQAGRICEELEKKGIEYMEDDIESITQIIWNNGIYQGVYGSY